MKNKLLSKIQDKSDRIILLIIALLVVFSEMNFNFNWFVDINIWLSEIFWQLFLFLVFSVLFQKITDDRLSLLYSIVPTILVTHTIVLSFNREFNGWVIVAIILTICYVLYFYSVFRKYSIHKIEKEREKKHNERKVIVNNMNDEEKAIIYKCKELESEYSNEFNFIRQYGMESVDEVFNILEELKNESKNKN